MKIDYGAYAMPEMLLEEAIPLRAEIRIPGRSLITARLPSIRSEQEDVRFPGMNIRTKLSVL